jgi:predicted dehydrogenase
METLGMNDRSGAAKRVAYIGGFGHWSNVAGELHQAVVENVGAAPAYEGEDLSALRAHPALPDDLPFFTDAAELLSAARPDLVVVSTRLDRIPGVAVQVAEAGCDIICEKPLGLTLDQLRTVRDAVVANGVRLLPMLNMRTDPVFVKAREMYRSGIIGEASLINARKSYRYGNRPEWVGVRATYGGTIPWVGIHAADMIQYITGLFFVSVTARHLNFVHPEHPDCEDNCAALFELSNGGLATASIDLMRPTSLGGDDWIRIMGTKGVLEASSNDGEIKMIVSKDRASVIKADPKQVSFYAEMLKEGPGEFPLAGLNDGFLLTEAVLCARDSADQGGVPVRIPCEYKK